MQTKSYIREHAVGIVIRYVRSSRRISAPKSENTQARDILCYSPVGFLIHPNDSYGNAYPPGITRPFQLFSNQTNQACITTGPDRLRFSLPNNSDYPLSIFAREPLDTFDVLHVTNERNISIKQPSIHWPAIAQPFQNPSDRLATSRQPSTNRKAPRHSRLSALSQPLQRIPR